MFALQDIKSYGKDRTLYAKLGDEVTVFKRPHANVWLCECNGVKFACAPGKLGEEKPMDDKPIIIKPIDLFNQI